MKRKRVSKIFRIKDKKKIISRMLMKNQRIKMIWVVRVLANKLEK